MIAALNLASEPFRNRVLPWTITALVGVVALSALLWIVGASRAAEREAEQAGRRLSELKNQTREITLRADALKQEMPAEDLRTLEAAHALVDRKSFSWSGLLADLEAAVPAGVRVTRISVRDVLQTTPDSAPIAELNLTIVGRTTTDVTRMIAEMNRGGVFTATPVSEEAPGGAGGTGTEWALSVRYRAPVSRPVNPGAAEVTTGVARLNDDGVRIGRASDDASGAR